MRQVAILLLALCAALAQEDPRARARELEIQAGKALDEGRQADAMKLLKEAADLRAKVRDVAVPATPEAKPKAPAAQGAMAEPGKPQAPKPAAAPAPPAAKAAGLALSAMESALKNGDAGSALKSGAEARKALASWASELAERERRLAQAGAVEDRVARLERQVEELRKLAAR